MFFPWFCASSVCGCFCVLVWCSLYFAIVLLVDWFLLVALASGGLVSLEQFHDLRQTTPPRFASVENG